jgi:hypothetical protein
MSTLAEHAALVCRSGAAERLVLSNKTHGGTWRRHASHQPHATTRTTRAPRRGGHTRATLPGAAKQARRARLMLIGVSCNPSVFARARPACSSRHLAHGQACRPRTPVAARGQQPRHVWAAPPLAPHAHARRSEPGPPNAWLNTTHTTRPPQRCCSWAPMTKAQCVSMQQRPQRCALHPNRLLSSHQHTHTLAKLHCLTGCRGGGCACWCASQHSLLRRPHLSRHDSQTALPSVYEGPPRRTSTTPAAWARMLHPPLPLSGSQHAAQHQQQRC